MSYRDNLNQLLRPTLQPGAPVALDLFAGCGGLSLGFEAAGFDTIGYEYNQDAVDTYNDNLAGTAEAKFLTTDCRFPAADIVIGGPPCQPFSVGGLQKGKEDRRNSFPVFIEAIRQVRPAIFLFENVKGLLNADGGYFRAILKDLRALGYRVSPKILNAANYGVPQKRERLFVIGHNHNFRFPRKRVKVTTVGDAIGDLMCQFSENSNILTPSMDVYIAKYERASFCKTPRDLHSDKPARTLTCRNLSGYTGDMLRILLEDGRRRKMTVFEAASLQSFPDWFRFSGSETSQFVQIGNAVPPLMAYRIAEAIGKVI